MLACSCTTPRRHRATLTKDAPPPTGWQGWYGIAGSGGRKSASPRIFRNTFRVRELSKSGQFNSLTTDSTTYSSYSRVSDTNEGVAG